MCPHTAIAASRSFKSYFCHALHAGSVHYFIGVFTEVSEAWRSPVKSQANGIKNCGLARARGTSNQKKTISIKLLVSKINFPLSGKGIKIFKAQRKDFHRLFLPHLWMSALKSKHFNAEDRQAKSVVFAWLTWLPGAKSRRILYRERFRSPYYCSACLSDFIFVKSTHNPDAP